MKKWYGFVLLLLLGNVVTAQNVIFSQKSWPEIKAQAKQENKPIYLFFGNSGSCGSCVVMDEVVFKDEAVANFFNTNFINYRVDLKSVQGFLLITNHTERNFPYSLFLDHREYFIHDMLGETSPDDFLKEGKIAVKAKPVQKLALMDDTGNPYPATRTEVFENTTPELKTKTPPTKPKLGQAAIAEAVSEKESSLAVAEPPENVTVKPIAAPENITIKPVATELTNNPTMDKVTETVATNIKTEKMDTIITHIVKKGETLYRLSKDYYTSIQSIKDMNKLTSNTLEVGQKLQIKTIAPQMDVPVTPMELNLSRGVDNNAKGLKTHVVRTGDTLYGISKMYKVSIERIKALNNLGNNGILIGQELIVMP